MPRDLPVGNGSLLVAFDSSYRLADFYFPHVGMENQAASRFRMGVWCDGALHPCDDETRWQLSLEYLRDTRPFRPHLTLGRVKRELSKQESRALAQAARSASSEEAIMVESIDLMGSDLGQAGPAYTVLASAPLGGA